MPRSALCWASPHIPVEPPPHREATGLRFEPLCPIRSLQRHKFGRHKSRISSHCGNVHILRRDGGRVGRRFRSQSPRLCPWSRRERDFEIFFLKKKKSWIIYLVNILQYPYLFLGIKLGISSPYQEILRCTSVHKNIIPIRVRMTERHLCNRTCRNPT